jgi:hypothetical protein
MGNSILPPPPTLTPAQIGTGIQGGTVPNLSQKYWLRAFRIQIVTPSGTYTITNTPYESIRVKFEVDMSIYPLRAYWQASVTLYNMANITAAAITSSTTNMANPYLFNQPLHAGDFVSISGGYQYGPSGVWNADAQELFSGRVFQSIVTKENVVDAKLTLRCITALVEDIWNYTNATFPPGYTDFQKITGVATPAGGAPGKAVNSVPIEYIDPNAQNILSSAKTQQPMAESVSARPLDFIQGKAYQHNLYSWISPKGLNIRSFGPTDFQGTPVRVYGPPPGSSAFGPGSGGSQNTISANAAITGSTPVTQTLLGVPEQTQDGITFRVLMDSGVKIGDLVQIQPGTVIQAVPLQYGGNELPPIPSMTGIYIIGGLRHCGDSRGQGGDWYTEIIGLSADYFTNFLGARTLGAFGNILLGIA